MMFFLTALPPYRATAQEVLRQFSYDNLGPTALQADLGALGASRLRGAVTGGLRLDYGLVAPRIRVLLGLSYYRAQFSSTEIARFESRLRDLVQDPEGNATVDVGTIDWADLTGDIDLQYVLPQGRSVTAYLGLGLSVHLRSASGPAIDGTFLEDALDDVAAGLNGTLGAEFVIGPVWRLTVDARGVLLSDHRTASLRGGVMYRWRERARGRSVRP
ncbi:MAG TPA: hypothetical protein VGA20_10950 [Gemmatimonadales bacterium]